MPADDLITELPHEPTEATAEEALLSNEPSIFILNTHFSLDELHQAENSVTEHGGKLTWDINEAPLVLGKIGQKKRATLELRSRGLWTEEIISRSSTVSKDGQDPPQKRQKVEGKPSLDTPGVDIFDLSTESEDEEDGMKSQHDPGKLLVKPKTEPVDIISVLKLDWLNQSITAGKPLPHDSFLIYRGRKTSSSHPALPDPPPEAISSQIIKRAKEDAASQPIHTFPPGHYHRRTKESPDDPSHKRPPILHRETTSEKEDHTPTPPQPIWVREQVLYACLRSTPLHPPNEDFITQLLKIRRIRELTLDEIGVRAYSTSIAALAAYPYPLRRPSEVLALPGCEAKIANLFAEFQQHGGCKHTDDDGNVAAADELETNPVLRVLNTFNEIWGVGAKTARDFYYRRGWRDLDDIVEYGWDTLSRVQQIGVKFFEEFQTGVPRAECEAIADIVKRHANRVRPKGRGEIDCILVGGYRRGKEISGDVDIILTHRDDAVTKNLVVDVVASLETELYITHTLSLHVTSSQREQQTLPFHGDETGKHFDTLDKALVVWQEPANQNEKNLNPHRRVDIIISPWQTVGCAVLGWSGDTTFQRDLRRYAKKAHAWKFDSSGVREQASSGQVVDLEHGGETWEEREKLVMERLGIGWRPPEERCSR
ncbi:hypothetical protein N7532_003643 [Penicillium argentinense]|uniref:BRCT domain-containing protein n=1 Tax=Penicillium argentinense TaxID=1131581 RepID=A0A9W9FMY0_9EURO|nr:uncharacterized protein N7532_003643 [Penicillium argentinense]KAJ5103114.1 hypothetical protein N7532_003643 [Penicillium argentinense]